MASVLLRFHIPSPGVKIKSRDWIPQTCPPHCLGSLPPTLHTQMWRIPPPPPEELQSDFCISAAGGRSVVPPGGHPELPGSLAQGAPNPEARHLWPLGALQISPPGPGLGGPPPAAHWRFRASSAWAVVAAGAPPRRGSASPDWLDEDAPSASVAAPRPGLIKGAPPRRARAEMRSRLVPWTAAWGCCAFLACLALDTRGPSCSATEYQEGGRCCRKCGPGTKVAALCSEGSETRCVACEAQHFQAGWTKEKHCTPQAYCDENAGFLVHTEGSATRNVVCRCRIGTHCSSPECLTCSVNRVCPAGEGVQREASHLNDTVCVACPPGSFSNISSATARCQRWSSCEDRKMVRMANGTHISDVVCGVLPTQPPQEEARRTHVLLAVPLVALLGLLVGALFLLRRHRRCQGLWKPRPNQPEEVDDPAFPTQETLLEGQPVNQEDGKESHLAEQEQT